MVSDRTTEERQGHGLSRDEGLVAFKRCGDGERWGGGAEECRKRLSPNRNAGRSPFPHQQMSSSFLPATVVTSLQRSLHPGFSEHSFDTPFHRPPRTLPSPLYLTSKGITSLLCTLTWNTLPPPFPRPRLLASEKLEGKLLLGGGEEGESQLEPSDETDLDSASEPEGPLAITSRASSVTRPSSQAGKWQSQSQNAGSGPLVCSIFPTIP